MPLIRLTERLREIAEPLFFFASSLPRTIASCAAEPSRHRDDQPGKRRADEGGGDAAFHHQRKDNRKGQHAERAERGAGGVERGRLLPAAFAGETRFSLAADFMLLDQCRTGAEDGRKCEKKTADGRSIAAADKAGEDRRGAAKREADQVFVPAAFLAAMTAKSGSGVMSALRRGSAGRRRRSARRRATAR